MEKFQELNSIILRLQMNLSYNDTNTSKILHFWVEICIKLEVYDTFVEVVTFSVIQLTIMS